MVTLVVLAVGFVVAGAATLLSVLTADSRPGPFDADRRELWFVRHAPDRWQRLLRHLDRRVAGGAAAVLGFGLIFAAALGLGLLLDLIDDNRTVARVDRAASSWGAEHLDKTSVDVLEVITRAGSATVLVSTLTLVGVIAALRWRNVSVLGYLLFVFLGVHLLNGGLKDLVDRERPAIDLIASYRGSSFPSGHAAAASACWAAVAMVAARYGRRWFRRAAAALAALVAGLVAASRVMLGAHWLTDVVAGLVVGWTWFVLVTLLFGGRLLRFGNPTERVRRGSRRRRFGDEPSSAGLQ